MPMIHHLQWPPEVLTDAFSVVVDIYAETEGGYDDRGNPLPPQKHYYVQDAPADLQPKGGTQRAVQSATTYEASHTLFIFPSESWPGDLAAAANTALPADMSWPSTASGAAIIEAFFGKLAGEIPTGATVEVRQQHGTPRGKFTVVFVASWGTHLEIDLKAV